MCSDAKEGEHLTTLLGIQERAEGRALPPWVDGLEVLNWVIAFLASLVAAWWTLQRPAWQRPFLALVAPVALLFGLLCGRPPLPLSVLLDLALLAGLVGARGASQRAPAAVGLRPAHNPAH